MRFECLKGQGFGEAVALNLKKQDEPGSFGLSSIAGSAGRLATKAPLTFVKGHGNLSWGFHVAIFSSRTCIVYRIFFLCAMRGCGWDVFARHAVPKLS